MQGSRKRHSVPTPFDRTYLAELRDALSAGDRIGVLVRMADSVLGVPLEDIESRFADLCSFLEREPKLARSVGEALTGIVRDFDVRQALVESNMMSSVGFLPELGARVFRRFLPELYEPDDLRTILRRVFARRDDHVRLDAIPDALWIKFLSALGITGASDTPLEEDVEISIRMLASHAASLGLQPDFMRRLTSDSGRGSPFLMLTERVLAYTRRGEVDLLKQALETIGQCKEDVRQVRYSMSIQGSSLALTRDTHRLLRLLDRLDVLLRLTDRTTEGYQEGLARLFRELVSVEKTRNHIVPHARAQADLLAYQVVEHAARKGGKYITSGRRDYGRFFMASLGGGAIVAVFSFFKVFLGKLDMPLGIEALMYGLNYSACFVLIYMTGAALATKQPAMTANTIAQALGRRQDRHLEQLEALVVRVWRSQFVSFAGNLLMALPVAFALSEIFYRSKGTTITSAGYADSMLSALHPWQSGTIFFAAVAGLFLFVSGLISGWVDNRYIYTDIRQRIAEQPAIAWLVGAKRVQSLADYLHRNLGALVGNVFLGFALGSTGTIGEIFGLPLDIRHIAFASAEFGTALEILQFRVALSIVWPVAVGVALIGLVNFVVSFGLSFAVAVESRQITWQELRILYTHLAQSFFRRPFDWFFPPRPRHDNTGEH